MESLYTTVIENNKIIAHRYISKLTIVILLYTCFSANAQNTMYYNKYKHWSEELENMATSSDARYIVCLGSCYDRADGVQQNRMKAFELFKRAAAMGDILGKYNLALYYHRGYCSEPDNKSAVTLLNDVIIQDSKFAPAYSILADIHEKGGYGIRQDKVLAFNYWQKLADTGDAYGYYVLGQYYQKGLVSESNISMAAECFEKAANLNEGITSLYAMDNLAACYIEKRDFKNAFYWLDRAYSENFLIVCHNLADMYYYGNGVEQSYEKALEIFTRGADENPNCKYRLSIMYREGLGTAINLEKSRNLLKGAADSGVGRAQYLIGMDYYNGNNINQNYTEAIRYMNLALESKYVPDNAKGEICRKLSACYRFGRGTTVDVKKADELTSLSAQYGDTDSQLLMQWLNIIQ